MNSNIVNATPPSGYPICRSKSCPKQANCLHAVIAQRLLETEPIYTEINPHHPTYKEGDRCPHYRSARPQRYARGFLKALRTLSQSNYVACTNRLIAQRTKTHFYRIRRGDIALSPEEQRELVETLRSYGYEGETPFDSYEDRITWY